MYFKWDVNGAFSLNGFSHRKTAFKICVTKIYPWLDWFDLLLQKKIYNQKTKIKNHPYFETVAYIIVEVLVRNCLHPFDGTAKITPCEFCPKQTAWKNKKKGCKTSNPYFDGKINLFISYVSCCNHILRWLLFLFRQVKLRTSFAGTRSARVSVTRLTCGFGTSISPGRLINSSLLPAPFDLGRWGISDVRIASPTFEAGYQ